VAAVTPVAPAPASTPASTSAPTPIVTGRLRLVVEGGDTETVYDLKDETVIGRRRGDITFAHDGFMSNSHARIVRRGGGFFLTDEGSRNGVYVKLKNPVKLESGDFILVGRQLFQFKA
jgi:pSer/pThr/pTyr-binding forkhead associated (FHA) protein